MNDVYFELKQAYLSPKNRIELGEICSFICEESIKRQLSKIEIQLKEPVSSIDAFGVVERIKKELPDCVAYPLGNTKCSLALEEKTKVNAGVVIKVIVAGLVLFFGGAMAIMNFHADVDMKAVHSFIYYFATGQQADRPLIVSIPYSVGVLLGFLFALNIFHSRKKKEPNIVELDVHDYQKKVKNYIDEKNDTNDPR